MASCMVLALVQDWASSAAVPLMGGPRVGAASNPQPGIRAEGAPDSSIRWAPVHSKELIICAATVPLRWAFWQRSIETRTLAKRQCAAPSLCLSCTLSCFVVTHPVPPVCDQCLRRECLWLTPGRSLLLRLFVSSIYCVYQKTKEPRARELRSATSEPDDRHRATG